MRRAARVRRAWRAALSLAAIALGLAATVPGTAAAGQDRVFADPFVLRLHDVVETARVADLDRDGLMDLVGMNASWIQVWTGTPDSLLRARPEATRPSGLTAFEVADLDGDDIPDLVGTSEFDSIAVTWLRGRGDGSFEDPRALLKGTGWHGLAVGCFDGDEKPDVATVDASDRLVLLRNTGGGEFEVMADGPTISELRSLGSSPSVPGVASLLVSSSSGAGGGGQLSFWRRLPGAWTVIGNTAGSGVFDDHLFVDLNGDGAQDWCGLDTEGGHAATALRDLGGAFKDVTGVACRSDARGSAGAGDLDGDGLADLVMPSQSDYWRLSRVEILYSRADGSRDNLIRLTLDGYGSQRVVARVGDFDGDGHNDIAAFRLWDRSLAYSALHVIRGHGGRRFDAITHWPGDEHSQGLFTAQLDRTPARELVSLSTSHFGVSRFGPDGMMESPRFLHPAPSVNEWWGDPAPVFFRDLNGDGFDDLLMRNGAQFSVALATGEGTLGEARHEAWPDFKAVGDLDGRFGPDAVFFGADGEIAIAFRTSSGWFHPPVSTGTRFRPLQWGAPTLLRCADLDRDGREELIVGTGRGANCDDPDGGADTLSILRWAGSSFATLQRTPIFDCFRSRVWYGPEFFRDVAVFDIDGVGMLDIAVLKGGWDRGRVVPLTDGGEGFYTPSAWMEVGSEGPRELAEGDFDGDGLQELAVSHNSDGSIARVSFKVFHGTVLATEWPGTFVAENSVQTLAAGDFDGDGDDDLATIHWTGAWQDWWDESSALTVRWSLASENAAVTNVIDSRMRGARTAAPADLVRISTAWPNPARDAVHVRFATLPSGEARLELLDVTGRRVQEQALAGTAGGEGTARFALGRDLAPGVYWLRLAQGGRNATTRIAVIR